MVNVILTDLWTSFHLLLTCIIISATVIINVFFAFRVMYMTKNYKDPIKAFQKNDDFSPLSDMIENDKQYKDMNQI